MHLSVRKEDKIMKINISILLSNSTENISQHLAYILLAKLLQCNIQSTKLVGMKENSSPLDEIQQRTIGTIWNRKHSSWVILEGLPISINKYTKMHLTYSSLPNLCIKMWVLKQTSCQSNPPIQKWTLYRIYLKMPQGVQL